MAVMICFVGKPTPPSPCCSALSSGHHESTQSNRSNRKRSAAGGALTPPARRWPLNGDWFSAHDGDALCDLKDVTENLKFTTLYRSFFFSFQNTHTHWFGRDLDGLPVYGWAKSIDRGSKAHNNKQGRTQHNKKKTELQFSIVYVCTPFTDFS